jgi:membrane protein implicated in regulation of membrane protease activity
MNVLTVLLCIWAMVALCAVLFIRGASRRVKRPSKAKQTRSSRFSIAE